MDKKVRISIVGRNTYEKWSVYQWVLECADILENEYGINIEVSMANTENESPAIVVNGERIDQIPFEEGYVIEALKKALDRVVDRSKSSAEDRANG